MVTLMFHFECMAKWTRTVVEVKLSDCGKKARPDQEAVVTERYPPKMGPGLYSLDQCWPTNLMGRAVHSTHHSVNPLSVTNSDCWSCKKKNFAISDTSVVVCLLWDPGGKELSAAESWCPLREGSAWEGPGRSGSYWQWLQQIVKHAPFQPIPSHIKPNTSWAIHLYLTQKGWRESNSCAVSREIATMPLLDLSGSKRKTKRNVRASRM